ncbi:MAG TPA: CHASE3 domain-containing protein [Tepidisphaeraceae bacterium]|jgi:PAS domain S-box-containing protein|nr:CHASE3 domain-containing protein [Tepidisphaeraceae bacterium]
MISAIADSSEARPTILSLERQVTLGFAAAVVMLLVVGVVSYNSISRFIVDSFWSRHTYEVLGAIHALHETTLEAESYTRAYVISGNRHYLDSDRATVLMIDSRLFALQSLTSDNSSQARRIKILRPLLAKKIDVMQRQCQLRESSAFDLAAAMAIAESGFDATYQMRQVLTDMEAEENRLLARRRLENENSGRRAILFIKSSAGLTLVLLTIAGVVIHRTIAARTRSEAALRASDTMFRGLIEGAPDAMVIVNEKSGIEFFNAQAEALFGYTVQELRGQPIELIIPQRYETNQIDQTNGGFASMVVPGTRVGRELVGIRKDGAEIPIEISLSPIKTPLGLRVSNAIRDVTRRKQEEQALKNLNAALEVRTAQLEVANKELESFSYSVSHDLRAPLRSIDGFSQAILEDNAGKLDDESEDNLRRVRASSQKMGHLIDDLLNLARVSRADMNRESVDVSKMAREVIDDLRATNPDSNAEISIADGLIAEADPRLLRVVLTNLLSNAWKFTATRPTPRIEFGCTSEGGETQYFVRDNGVGFDMTYVGKLFGAFQRLHAMAEFPGTGVGLATVQRIIHRHGGRVWADAELQVGATFRFTLPSPEQHFELLKAA